MSTSKDKSFPEKLKGFLKNFKAAPSKAKCEEFVILTEELEADLKPESPLANRLKAVKELTELCKSRKAELYVVEKVWTLVNDLLRAKDGQVHAKETRHLTFDLLIALCQSPLEKSGAVRAKLFEFIKSHENVEDILPRFRLLKSMTNNGKDISYFEDRVGPILHEWIGHSHLGNIPVGEFMGFLVNVIKFNSPFLDQDILLQIIQNVCVVSCTCSSREDISECLEVLNVVLGYGKLPNCLPNFLATLCRTVNVDTLCQSSWKIMKNLLGTHLGHSGVYTMCGFMENGDQSDISVVRGAVFFVGTSLWGSKLVRSLRYSPNPALISFDKALNRRNALVTYEVILRVEDLVKSSPEGLQTITWDLILRLISKVLGFSKTEYLRDDAVAHTKIMKALNDTLDAIEAILNTKSFCGQVEQFYQLIDSCYLTRPVGSVEKLMQYKVSTQLHALNPQWFTFLIDFAEKHVRREVRSAAKAKAMPLITKICLANREIYEEDLISNVILPHMKTLDSESDAAVRVSGVNFLVDFLLESTSKKCHDLLHILDKIINRPYEIHAQTAADTLHIYSESEVDDILRAVEGIIKIFKKKIYYLPSSIAVSCYKSLVKHLTHHYKTPAVLDNCYKIRYKIFECFFEIRANSLYHLGFPEGAKGLAYSSYLAVDHREGDEKIVMMEQDVQGLSQITTSNASHPASANTFQSTSGASPVTVISLTAACKLVVGSLKKEKDWSVLQLVLRTLPSVLENKALILSKHGNDIDYLATHICAMIMDRSLNLPESLRNCPQVSKFSKTDFQAFLYPIFTSLVSYHSHLDSATQQKIVKCLQQGLVSKCCRMCILALTVCTLEMKVAMHKLLGEVLLSLSKISPKLNIAIPVLEFLSTLIHLPRVFASFVQDQYMSIFAIALPYTNPFKFNQYTVSLAHHVIAMWFLKCRLSFRRQFVGFIIKGLESNVLAPMREMEEESRRNALELRNEDSSNRKRSSSLTDRRQPDQRRDRPITGHPSNQGLTSFDSKAASDKSLQTFHQELTETCIDFMTRYAFADCSALPTRFSTTNFLIEGGISKSWMVDNKIITITTSGCNQKELKEGVCDKCYTICRKQRSSRETRSPSKDPSPSLGRSLSVRDTAGTVKAGEVLKRRRHVSAYAGVYSRRFDPPSKSGSVDENAITGGNEAKDDLHLEQKSLSETEELEDEKNISSSTVFGGSVPFIPDISQKSKSENLLCNCWCAGWAEILIRTPSGNTSWMMRVQNHIGNNLTDPSAKDLSSVFLQNIVEPCQTEFYEPSATSSTLSSPTHSQQPLLSHNSISQDSVLAGCGDAGSPSAPASPTAPDSPPPTDDGGRKAPVRRSNSSPEMPSNWKAGPISLQRDIEEEDDETTLAVISPSAEPKKGFEPEQSTKPDSPPATTDDVSVAGPSSGLKGSSSPFRRSYEAIPEENTQRSGSLTGSPEHGRQLELLNPVKRDRVSTISVMMPARRNPSQVRRMLSLGSGDLGTRDTRLGGLPEAGVRSGVSPSFIFLQLCAQGLIASGSKPILLPQDDPTERSLRNLDYITPYETHKIGVVYVGPGQAKNETAILQNQYGSCRYREFLQGLGSFIKLTEVDPQKVFLGGLSKDGEDGDFACNWQDDVMQVMFHVATLMPNKSVDPQANCKKRHVGNDYVTIVYNNSDEDYEMTTIKAQFLYACVIIQPLEHKTNRVVVKALPDLAEHIGHTEAKIVSDQNLPTLTRQLALHANLASLIFQKMKSKTTEPYASNWLERLRNIKRLRARLLPVTDSGLSSSEELSNEGLLPMMIRRQIFDDFTENV